MKTARLFFPAAASLALIGAAGGFYAAYGETVSGYSAGYSAGYSEACTMDYSPVCGEDGKTYSNRCMAESGARVTVSHDGVCSPRVCTREYRPVCGTDGVTYDNRCVAETAVVYPGMCLNYSATAADEQYAARAAGILARISMSYGKWRVIDALEAFRARVGIPAHTSWLAGRAQELLGQ